MSQGVSYKYSLKKAYNRTRHGGGILLACNTELGCVRRLDFETDCEVLWCEMIIPSQGSKFLVGVFYRPPSSDAAYLSELQKSLSLIDRSGTNLPLLLLGDFNLPNITWGEVPKCHDALSAVLCEVVDDYFLQQMVSEPTRRGNILDLIFTNTPEFLMNINVCEGLGNSDHFSIEFDWKIKLGSLKQTPRFVNNFRTADWDGLKEDLVKIPWDTIYLMSSVDDVWEAWKTLFFQAVERNNQKKLTKRRRDVPWLNSDLKKLLHKKRRLLRKAKFSDQDQAKWANYKKFSNLVKDNLNKALFCICQRPHMFFKHQSETLLVIRQIMYKETEHTWLYHIRRNSRVNSRGQSKRL